MFRKNDKRTTYNVVYRDGKAGTYFYKRFNVTSMTHDREYDLTQGKAGSRVVYFTANPNGEAEVIRVALKPSPKIKKLAFECDFGELQIKGRQSRGNTLTKNDVYRITLKSHGVSTLGGCKIWFDKDINRLNIDGRGEFIGEYRGDDKILVVLDDGTFIPPTLISTIITNLVSSRWRNLTMQRYGRHFFTMPRKTISFILNASTLNVRPRRQNFLGEEAKSQLVCLTSDEYSRFRITFGGTDEYREPLEIEATEFVGVKSFKARGKRVTTFNVEGVEQIPSLLKPKESPAEETADGLPAENNGVADELDTDMPDGDDDNSHTLFE